MPEMLTLVAAEKRDQPSLVLRLVPRILPGIALSEAAAVTGTSGIKRFPERAVGEARAREPGFRIENVAPVLSALFESGGNIVAA